MFSVLAAVEVVAVVVVVEETEKDEPKHCKRRRCHVKPTWRPSWPEQRLCPLSVSYQYPGLRNYVNIYPNPPMYVNCSIIQAFAPIWT